jgi:hypothetical protein
MIWDPYNIEDSGDPPICGTFIIIFLHRSRQARQEIINYDKMSSSVPKKKKKL